MSYFSLSCLLSQFTFPSRLYEVDVSTVLSTNCLLNFLFSWYNSAIASCSLFSCWDDSRTSMLSVPVLLRLSQISWLEPSTGFIQTTCMSNLSTTNWACGSFEYWASPGSFLFVGLPLFQGTGFWGDETSTVFPFPATPSIFSSALWYVASPMGRRGSRLWSLGMSAEKKNESQCFPSRLNSSTINNLINETWDSFFFS